MGLPGDSFNSWSFLGFTALEEEVELMLRDWQPPAPEP